MERKNIEWLKEQYGDDLKTVIEHNDESHPHLHAFILPDDLKCSKYNIGKIAKDDFMKSKEADEIKDNKEKINVETENIRKNGGNGKMIILKKLVFLVV